VRQPPVAEQLHAATCGEATCGAATAGAAAGACAADGFVAGRPGAADRTLAPRVSGERFSASSKTRRNWVQLLIAVLQLLDRPGELPDLRFQAIDTHRRIAALWRAILCDGRALFAPVLKVLILWGRPRSNAIAIAENAVKETRLLAQACGAPEIAVMPIRMAQEPFPTTALVPTALVSTALVRTLFVRTAFI